MSLFSFGTWKPASSSAACGELSRLFRSSLRRLDFVSHVFDVSLGFVFRIDLLVVLKNPGLPCFVLAIQLIAFQFRFQQDLQEADDVSGIGKRFVMVHYLFYQMLESGYSCHQLLLKKSSMGGCRHRGNQSFGAIFTWSRVRKQVSK